MKVFLKAAHRGQAAELRSTVAKMLTSGSQRSPNWRCQYVWCLANCWFL
ncbi:hypothetical protein LEMLEM_LOCUS19999 [Lemmus lemmus]